MADRYLSLQMNICRQCFREKSQDIGFNKVGFLFDYIRMASMSNLWDTKTDGVFFFSTYNSTVKIRTRNTVVSFFSFCLFSTHSSSRYVFSDFTLLGAW